MAEPDQMNRKELLEARAKVSLQIERLNYRGYKGTTLGDPTTELMADLRAILQEINTELAELDSK